MEANEENLQALAHYLQLTFDPTKSVRKEAEEFLQTQESSDGWAQLVLHMVTLETVDQSLRLAGAIYFKNFVKRQWNSEEPTLSEGDRAFIKASVLELLIQTNDACQKQLSEAIAIIAKVDFPERWDELMPSLVQQLQTMDFHAIIGVLSATNPIFWKYRYTERSDDLFREIIYVLEHLASPITTVFEQGVPALQAGPDAETAASILKCLDLVVQVFHSLNAQDLPAFFEDHMKEWMTGFSGVLAFPASGEDDDEGQAEQLKSNVCQVLCLYARKYDDDCGEYVGGFVEQIWQLLTTTGSDFKFDQLVSNALSFLTVVASHSAHKELFADPDTLKQIFEMVIIPNMILRDSDGEMFEDDPEEFIRRDMEGSDAETRRRGANELIRGLCKYWEEKVTALCSDYVSTLLAAYEADPAENWPQKDAAVFLVSSLATRAKVEGQGITQVNDAIDIMQFLEANVVGDLQPDVLPPLQAAALKFVTLFRQQISTEAHGQLFPLVINHLNSPSTVVGSYAAAYIDRILIMKREGQPLISSEGLSGVLEPLLTGLFEAMARADHSENEYIMKAIMRTIVTAKAMIEPYILTIINCLSEKLVEVSKNPGKPRFNHYMFESFGCCVRFSPADTETIAVFEQAFFPPFEYILSQGVEEFTPYAFQLLSQLLEKRPAPIPETYMALLGGLTSPDLWQNTANTTPLVRLLNAFLVKGRDTLFTTDQELLALLGVFQKLIASRMWDHEGFNLLQHIIECLSMVQYQEHFGTILTLLLQRMQSSRTPKFTKGFLVFLCHAVAVLGGTFMVQSFEGIQENLFSRILNRVLSDVQKVSGDIERKTCAIGLTKLITETPEVLANPEAWLSLLECQLKLFELPTEETDDGVDEEAQSGYKAAFNKLAFAGDPTHDPFEFIPDARAYFAQEITKFFSANPDVQQTVPANFMQMIQGYCS
eukprot:m.118464 g.118464  ORF g.118464 m.118464 type:complete len:939 (-) comp13655_c0_seq2:4264-7080(-)